MASDIDTIDIEQVVKQTPAIMGVDEAQFLYDMVSRAPVGGAIVEIGSYVGGSTILLAHAARAAHREAVYAIDPHWGTLLWHFPFRRPPSLGRFLENIQQAGLESFVKPIIGFSSVVCRDWNTPISLLWIDGSHWYRAVKQDLLDWEPFVMEGGFVIMHDAIYQKIERNKATHTSKIPGRFFGVEQAAHELLATGRFEMITTVTSLLCVAKKRSGTVWEFRRARLLRPLKSALFFPLEVYLLYYRVGLGEVHGLLGRLGAAIRSLGIPRR